MKTEFHVFQPFIHVLSPFIVFKESQNLKCMSKWIENAKSLSWSFQMSFEYLCMSLCQTGLSYLTSEACQQFSFDAPPNHSLWLRMTFYMRELPQGMLSSGGLL